MSFRLEKYFTKTILVFVMLMLGLSSFAQQVKTYDEAITSGDNYFAEKEFMDAKAYYQLALSFKSNDEYANQQIDRIVEEMSSQMQREDRYLEIVEEADLLFNKNKFDEALIAYGKALAVIPDDDYAQQKIDKIYDFQTNQKEKLAKFNTLMSEGKKFVGENKFDEAIFNFKKAARVFPDNSEPKILITEAKELQVEYDGKMETLSENVELANRYLSIKDYVKALEQLELALELFPENWAVENEIEKYMPLAKKQEEYNLKLEEADKLYVSRDYVSAKKMYQLANTIWSENAYAADMISKIDNQLNLQLADVDKNYMQSVKIADSLFDIAEYDVAKSEYNFSLSLKPDESYPKTKIAEIEAIYADERKSLEAEYSTIILAADSFFASENFDEAKMKYELALSIDPNDNYPASQLEEIGIREKVIAEQMELQLQYQAVIDLADGLVVDKQYTAAIEKYNEAIKLKPEEEYSVIRISEIEMHIANAAKQQEIDEEYSKQIALAERLFSENNLTDARSTYLIAAELKPLEEYPKDEVKRIDSLVNQRELEKITEEQYQLFVNQSDSLQEIKLFDVSIIAINEALSVKPGDAFASNKLENLKIEKVAYEELMATKAAYENNISEADKLFATKDYLASKLAYVKALEIKDEAYPKNKVLEINGILERIEAENTRKYNEAIVKADNYFTASNLSEAVIQFKIASSLKPEENYPKEKIAESNSLIEEKLRLVRNDYTLAIADADKLYAARIYDKAIAGYQKAYKIFPEEVYPQEMITKITKFIEENSVVDVISQSVTISSNTKETLKFEPVKINVRKSNYIFIKATNLSGNAFKIIFGYGSDKGKNGGFVVQVPEGSDQNDFIIRVGNQYKWFSEDNNWLSIYPENGDIEISLVRISKGD